MNSYLTISVGLKNCYFTLRYNYLYEGFNGYEVFREWRSHHIKNLSQNAEEAIEKATDYANNSLLELRATLDSIKTELNEIKRRTAEEMEAARREQEAQEKLWEEERLQHINMMLEKIENGIFPFGAYADRAFSEAPTSYINWIAKGEFDDKVMIALADAIRKSEADRILPEVSKDSVHVGEVGKRSVFELTLIKSITIDSYYGTTRVLSFVDKDRNLVTSFYSGYNLGVDLGETVSIKGTVKSQGEYEGVKQTILNRIAVVN